MLALLFLILAAAAGTLAFRRLLPPDHPFGMAESVAAGVVLGTLITSWLPFALAYVVGFNTLAAGLALLLTLLLAAWLGWQSWQEGGARHRPVESLLGWLQQPDNQLFLAVLVVAGGSFAYLFHTHLLQDYTGNGDMYSGGSVWGDLAVHLSIISSLVYGDNFPPENPVYIGYPLGYHFMPDFQSAVLMLLGFNLRWSMLLPSVLISAALVTLVFSFARHLSGRGVTALLASLLFWLNGGLGFIYVLDERRASSAGWWGYLSAATHNANLNEPQNIQFVNFICDIFLPQRASLFGFTMGVLVLLLLYHALDQGRGPRPDWRPVFALAGTIVGLVPLMHSASFPTLMAITGCWALLTVPAWDGPGLKAAAGCWIWFFAPALLLMIPQALLFIIPQVEQGKGGFIRFNLDWVNKGDPWLWFWTKNVGIVFLLLPPALWRADRRLLRLYVPFLLLFVGLEFVTMQPNVYDNLKYYLYWYLPSAVLVADLLADLMERDFTGLYLAVCLVVLGCASGLLSLGRDFASHYVMFTASEVELGREIRERTPPRSVFVTSDLHRHAVPCLAGRRVVMGYKGWLWTWGFDYAQRDRDIQLIYRGGDAARRLLARYGVDYVFLGASERERLQANEAYWRANYPVAADFPTFGATVYAAKGGPPGPR